MTLFAEGRSCLWRWYLFGPQGLPVTQSFPTCHVYLDDCRLCQSNQFPLVSWPVQHGEERAWWRSSRESFMEGTAGTPAGPCRLSPAGAHQVHRYQCGRRALCRGVGGRGDVGTGSPVLRLCLSLIPQLRSQVGCCEMEKEGQCSRFYFRFYILLLIKFKTKYFLTLDMW